MTQANYTYTFANIQEQSGIVWATDNQRGCYALQISVKDTQLFPRNHRIVPTYVADMIDLATAIYVADRLSVRTNNQTCSIHLNIPVRNPDNLTHAEIVEQLDSLLYWYTNDIWSFTFTKRTTPGRLVELQRRLPLAADAPDNIEVALWSGGLDSLAGLCNRITTNPATHFILFGTGGNSYIHSVQRNTANNVKRQFSLTEQLAIVQIPIHLAELANRRRNSALRTRGLIFMLLGAACAYLQGQNTLYIYENGIGAINLPYSVSEVGLDQARSVHPRSLLKLSNLASLLLDSPFNFRNPFLFWTKAQMCQVFLDTNSVNLIASTTTCDHRHRQKYTECGRCTSCLLRRQALAVNNIPNTTKYVVPDNRPPRPNDKLHLQAMLGQVETLRSMLAQPIAAASQIQQYKMLWEITQDTASSEDLSPHDMLERLLQMYSLYVHEWEQVQGEIEASMLGEKPASSHRLM